MTTSTDEAGSTNYATDPASPIRMTAAMKEGLDALQREYEAFVESSFRTLAVITDLRTAAK